MSLIARYRDCFGRSVKTAFEREKTVLTNAPELMKKVPAPHNYNTFLSQLQHYPLQQSTFSPTIKCHLLRIIRSPLPEEISNLKIFGRSSYPFFSCSKAVLTERPKEAL